MCCSVIYDRALLGGAWVRGGSYPHEMDEFVFGKGDAHANPYTPKGTHPVRGEGAPSWGGLSLGATLSLQ